MKEDRFEELMRDAAQTYRKPPQPDLDGMWTEIERETWGASRGRDDTAGSHRSATIRIARIGLARRRHAGHWYRIGPRVDDDEARRTPAATQTVASVGSVAPVRSDTSFDAPYERRDVAVPRTDGGAVDRAAVRDTVGTSRRQVRRPGRRAADANAAAARFAGRERSTDARAARGSRAGARAGRPASERTEWTDRTELDLINRALEQRDVIPRLRTAVADISAN